MVKSLAGFRDFGRKGAKGIESISTASEGSTAAIGVSPRCCRGVLLVLQSANE